jgi:hypothetical protein
VDGRRAADLYAQGWTLRQIGAELGVPWTAVGHQLRRAGVTMRRGAPPSYPTSTRQILELRDRGLTWTEVAEQVNMTVSGAWSRYPTTRHPSRHAWAVGSGCSPTPSTNTLPLAYEQPLPITLVETPTELNLPPHDEPPTVSPLSVVLACCMWPAPMATTLRAIATIWCWRSRM